MDDIVLKNGSRATLSESEQRCEKFIESVNQAATLPDFYRAILDAMPSPVIVVEKDVCVVDFNSVAGKMMPHEREDIIRKQAGQALNCLHSTETPEGCGHSTQCTECVIRNSVNDALDGNRVTRKKMNLEVMTNGKKTESTYLVTTAPLKYDDHNYVLLVMEDISELDSVRSMNPDSVESFDGLI